MIDTITHVRTLAWVLDEDKKEKPREQGGIGERKKIPSRYLFFERDLPAMSDVFLLKGLPPLILDQKLINIAFCSQHPCIYVCVLIRSHLQMLLSADRWSLFFLVLDRIHGEQ